MTERFSRARGALVVGFMAAFLSCAPAFAAAAAAAAAPATIAPAAAVAASNAAPEASEDIRDIRGPKFIFPTWLFAALLAAGVLLGVGAYAVRRRIRRRRLARIQLPFEIALQRLEAIRALMQPQSVREFSIAVTDTIRRYIEDRFRVIAAHRTTEEFLHDLLESSDASLVRHHDLLAEFLHHCDLAKFAGMSLSRQSMESLHQSARTFVLETATPAVAAETGDTAHSSGREARDSLPST
jgi:uncharacterized protein DUF4381